MLYFEMLLLFVLSSVLYHSGQSTELASEALQSDTTPLVQFQDLDVLEPARNTSEKLGILPKSINWDYCNSWPCQNGGTCKDVTDFTGKVIGYNCYCLRNYFGINCEFYVRPYTDNTAIKVGLPVSVIIFFILISCCAIWCRNYRRTRPGHVTLSGTVVHDPPPNYVVPRNPYEVPYPQDPPPPYPTQAGGGIYNPNYGQPPSSGYGQPPSSGYGQPPSSGYGQPPSSGYRQPPNINMQSPGDYRDVNYGQPPISYGQPSSVSHQSTADYTEPPVTYGQRSIPPSKY